MKSSSLVSCPKTFSNLPSRVVKPFSAHSSACAISRATSSRRPLSDRATTTPCFVFSSDVTVDHRSTLFFHEEYVCSSVHIGGILNPDPVAIDFHSRNPATIVKTLLNINIDFKRDLKYTIKYITFTLTRVFPCFKLKINHVCCLGVYTRPDDQRVREEEIFECVADAQSGRGGEAEAQVDWLVLRQCLDPSHRVLHQKPDDAALHQHSPHAGRTPLPQGQLLHHRGLQGAQGNRG